MAPIKGPSSHPEQDAELACSHVPGEQPQPSTYSLPSPQGYITWIIGQRGNPQSPVAEGSTTASMTPRATDVNASMTSERSVLVGEACRSVSASSQAASRR